MEHKIKNKKGSALAYALVIMTVVLIIMVSLLRYINAQLSFSFNRVQREEAFQVAESGIYYYRWYLAHQTSGRTAQQIQSFWQSGSVYGVATPYEDDLKDSDGTKIGRYRIEVQAPDVSSTIVIVKSTGWTYKDPGMKRVIQVRFRRPSWSEYAVLANDVMRFGQGTDIYGKIHSNDGIRVDGVAHNVVSSLVSSYDDPDHTGGAEFGVHTHVNPPPGSGINNNFRPLESGTGAVPTRTDVFQAGRQFPVSEVSFNGVVSDLGLMKTQAMSPNGNTINNCTATGCYFDSSYGRQIILKNNGTMDVCRVAAYDSASYAITSYKRNSGNNTCSTCSGQCAPTNYTIPNSGIIFVENNAWVEGTINNKKIAIAAANLIGGADANIYIGNNNLLYTNFDGRDIIGLVAQEDVTVIRDSQDTLTIDAALLAQSGRVGRDSYSGYDKTTITVNGSIATNQRYGFAYVDSNGNFSNGYHNRILNFDNNLLYYPPPYFPTGTDYSIDLWEEL